MNLVSFNRISILLLKISLISLVLFLVLTSAGYYWLVVANPDEDIKQENIEQILTMESPVFYKDGEEKIGVFFQKSHRQYLPYSKIPKHFINAIVAAEDRNFFNHYGVDFRGFARASLANIKAGRIVQGGSTLTQQTAKNLFNRRGRSINSKLKELLFALRLEYHYSKEEILEYYTNQFYVSGNGRGLGFAARHYFDKDPSELGLVEAAFIAGSVKRPNFYNPHIKKTEDGVRKAKLSSKRRTSYVLGQLYRQDYINANDYQRALVEDIPFFHGRTRYSLNTVMDLVKDGMADPIIEEAFAKHGIENVATSGIKVITTIDKDLQESGVYSLKSELSRLDVRLAGYERDLIQKDYKDKDYKVIKF